MYRYYIHIIEILKLTITMYNSMWVVSEYYE